MDRTGRSDVDKANPERRLLLIAADQLKKLGRDRVRLVAIAAEAGMTHANVYRYFPSREALLDAVASASLRPVETLLADLCGAPDPADDKLERMLLALARGYRDLLDKQPEVFALFADAVAGSRPLARRHMGRIRRQFGDAIDEGLAEGIFVFDDRESALSLLVDLLHRFIHPSAIQLDAMRVRSGVDKRLQACVNVALRALSGRQRIK